MQYAKARAVCVALCLLWSPYSVADAEQSYMLHCGGCHMADGDGAPPEVPGLKDLGEIVQLRGGRDYLVQVPGASQAPITDDELTVIVNYILRAFNAATLPESFMPLSLEEVSQARQLSLNDPLSARAQLIAHKEPPMSRSYSQ